MLPKHSRLTKETIETYLLKARRVTTSCFFVVYTQVPDAKTPQISISCSKKVAPTAVLRNKLRRRGYAIVAPLIPLLSPTTAILISYSKPETKASIADLRIELTDCLKKARLI